MMIVGDFTYGAENIQAYFEEPNAQLIIGKFCSLSKITVWLGGYHRHDWISTYPFGHVHGDRLGHTKHPGHPYTNGNVIIGNDVWIAHNVTIMSGVHIGDGAVIGTNSHVVKDVPPYTIVGGNPARVIKPRFEQNIIDKLLRLKWWDLPPNEISHITAILNSEPTEEKLNILLQKYNR